MRDWRNTFCFVADDSDKNLHLNQANLLIGIADTLHPGIHINKLFSDAFTRVDVPGGKSFPEMNRKIEQQAKNGALIINYTGHGGLIGWAAEVILDVPTIRGLDNYDNLPLFITATCEFSRFDDPEFTSAGEYVFLNNHGGGIGLLTTTRLAYAHANIVVNLRIYQHMVKDELGRMPRLGDLVRVSKIPSSHNYLNFVLLGDPALRLAYPKYDVITTQINDRSAQDNHDTIQALSVVTISGEIVDYKQEPVTTFNGYIYPKVYDKPTVYTTLGTDSESYPVDFELSDKVLYDGKVSVKDGEFTFSFMVPRDISFKYDFGKIMYYALDTLNFVDAWGSYQELLIGGIDESAEQDDQGPDINLYLDNRSFISGEKTSGRPLLIADISDEHGVSFTGNSLGRDITMHLDDDLVNSMVLNEYFDYHLNSYQSGTLEYQMETITQGWHTLELKAWDLQNNSTTEQIDFYIDDKAEILLSGVVNYPNPFTNQTRFGFVHNKRGVTLSIEIRIYDLNGRYIGQINEKFPAYTDGIMPIFWNGRDANGNEVPAGIYSYNITVSDDYGNKTTQHQKMIKMSD
ncbi:MAG: type IX secretion system sortase PorU, partial [bacterium]